MTIEEAIEILDPETSRNTLLEYKEEEQRLEACNEACRIAATALCAQQTPLDRSRWDGCPVCVTKGCETCKYTYCSKNEYPCCDCSKVKKYKPDGFCAACGRPLTEEAWEELERRINGGTTNLGMPG